MATLITTRYYLKRALTNPMDLALILLLPVAVIFLQVAINADFMETELGMTFLYQGYNLLNTTMVLVIMLMFIFMSGAYAGEFIFVDLRSANRWRLNAAPVPSSTYVFGAIITGTITGCITAIFVLGIGYFFFNIYLGNLLIIILITVLISLMSQFIGIIIALFAKSRGAINGISVGISFLFASMIGGFFVTIPTPQFFRDWILPMGVAIRALRASTLSPEDLGYTTADAFVSVGVLVATTVILAIATLIIARRRPA